MAKEVQGKQIAKNVSLSLFAQFVSLAVSFIMGLIVPKFIDEYQYAYWHTFLLYVSYVGVLHFGLLDGIVLRYSQYEYEELDKKQYRGAARGDCLRHESGWTNSDYSGSRGQWHFN